MVEGPCQQHCIGDVVPLLFGKLDCILMRMLLPDSI